MLEVTRDMLAGRSNRIDGCVSLCVATCLVPFLELCLIPPTAPKTTKRLREGASLHG